MVLNTISLAFAADPLMRWAMPTADRYLGNFAQMSQIFAGQSIDLGHCYVTEEGEGAALWLPHGVNPDEDALIALMSGAVPGERLENFGQVLEAMESYHPDDEDCMYLAIIGVDPGHQGRGMGAALMKHATSLLDDTGALGFLESSNPMNISLYQRHGFEIMGEIQLGDAPVVTPMIRERRG